ncbi:tail fiber assembly protein [Serratia sp. SRS-8-S-2018]
MRAAIYKGFRRRTPYTTWPPTQLAAWERYSVLLSRVEVSNPEWPDKPE